MIVSGLKTKTNLKTVTVDASELGDGSEIKLIEFTANQAALFNSTLAENSTEPDPRRKTLLFYANLITACAVNEENVLISSPEESEYIMANWPEKLILKIGGAAAELNGFAAGATDKEKKDSKPTRRGRS